MRVAALMRDGRGGLDEVEKGAAREGDACDRDDEVEVTTGRGVLAWVWNAILTRISSRG